MPKNLPALTISPTLIAAQRRGATWDHDRKRYFSHICRLSHCPQRLPLGLTQRFPVFSSATALNRFVHMHRDQKTTVLSGGSTALCFGSRPRLRVPDLRKTSYAEIEPPHFAFARPPCVAIHLNQAPNSLLLLLACIGIASDLSPRRLCIRKSTEISGQSSMPLRRLGTSRLRWRSA